MVKDVLPYKDVDSAWMEEKFGIPVSDKVLTPPDPDDDPDKSKKAKDAAMAMRVLSLISGGDPDFFA